MKKIIKKSLKFFVIILLTIVLFLALCSVATLGWGFVQMARGNVTENLPEAPENFTPAIRFIVFTDTHNENENLADAIPQK